MSISLIATKLPTVANLPPSYFLIHLYDEVRLTQEGDELSDAAKDELYETYENCGGDDIYVHCHTIDKLIKARKKDRKGKVSHYGRPSGPQYRGETYDEKMERLRDYLQGNHQL